VGKPGGKRIAGNLSTDGRIMLKWILKKQDGKEPSGSIKCRKFTAKCIKLTLFQENVYE
jgi:hypothetical protein